MQIGMQKDKEKGGVEEDYTVHPTRAEAVEQNTIGLTKVKKVNQSRKVSCLLLETPAFQAFLWPRSSNSKIWKNLQHFMMHR